MPTLPSRQELKTMMYRDLQKICKDWGVRANLKSDEMIDLLLEAQSHNMSPLALPRPPAQQRLVSTGHLTNKTGHTRQSSVIIHDVPSEANQRQDDPTPTAESNTNVLAAPSLIPVRTKKAKELQKRLGVGRPVAVGGSGPRMVTRSSTASQERRLRSNRHSRTPESAIPETSVTPSSPTSHPLPLSSAILEDAAQSTENSQSEQKQTSIPDVQQLLASIVKPLQEQIDTLRAELKRLQSLETEIQTLGALVKQTGISQSGGEARGWDRASSASKRLLYQIEPSTPPANFSLGLPPEPQTLMPSPKIITQAGIMGIAPVLLGKRPRESFISESPVLDDEDRLRTTNPGKKRLKLSEDTSADKGKETARDEGTFGDRDDASTTLPRTASFVVYNDPDEEESPPPNNTSSAYYTLRSGDPPGSPRHGGSTSSANTSENQNVFNFSLLPEPPTPGPTLFLPAFPYPEPPQSPTPSGANPEGSFLNNSDRSDVFKTFGLPPPDRARRLPSSSSSASVKPGAPPQPRKRHQPSSDDIRLGYNLMSTPAEPSAHQDKEISRVKKTMYGTELEGDTRFGDFGVEGVAMGFWTGGRF